MTPANREKLEERARHCVVAAGLVHHLRRSLGEEADLLAEAVLHLSEDAEYLRQRLAESEERRPRVYVLDGKVFS